MKILITGAEGFIGKNLILGLKNNHDTELCGYDLGTDAALLEEYCKEADFVYHLAGANRPKDESEFVEKNVRFTKLLLDTLKNHGNTCPVLYSSSSQALLDNPYGRSKKAAEELLLAYAGETGAKVFIYRFPNVFGKWCRPNYNSVVATLCHNTAHDLPVTINNPEHVMNLVYIDDLMDELIHALSDKDRESSGYHELPVTYTVTLGQVAKRIISFRELREKQAIPDMSDLLVKKLYSTYLSYLPEDKLSYGLDMHTDRRGSFTEFIKTPELGQLSVNIAKPGIVKGNHWHTAKYEKFLVVSGTGIIRLRNLNSRTVFHYYVSGEKLTVVEIPVGYVHNIENLGETDLITLIWASEAFDPEHPDTFFKEV
jgi:UDP-2-acetamido-2,6-beta-L-arabino-hexul-4-ose reductase